MYTIQSTVKLSLVTETRNTAKIGLNFLMYLFIHVAGVLNRKITINKTVFEKEAFILKETDFSIHTCTHDIQ